MQDIPRTIQYRRELLLCDSLKGPVRAKIMGGVVMEESDTIPIFELENRGKQKRRPGSSLQAVLAFLPLVFLLALSFYVWQWETVSTAEEGTGIALEEQAISSLPDIVSKLCDRQEVEVAGMKRGEPEEKFAVVIREPGPAKELLPAEESVLVEDNILVLGEQVYKYTASFEVSATAYCPGTPESGCPIDERGASQCTGFYNDGFTATGVPAVPGDGSVERPHLVAVDPVLIPLKSLLYVEGFGFARAEDTGSAIKGESIDLLFSKHDEAWIFGRQKLKIYVLDPHFAPYFR